MPKNLSNSANSINADWHKSVCRPAVTQRLAGLDLYVEVLPTSALSPIDNYFSSTEKLLRLGDPTFFALHGSLAGALLVAVISEVENYFRNLFARLLVLCPVSQSRSASRDIKLGSVIWYRTGPLEKGAFEHFSFASSDNVLETLSKYFDIKIGEKSDPFALLKEFDLVCELRHAVVHSAGMVSGKNALKLRLSRTVKSVSVKIDFQKFQEIVQLGNAIVCSINIELFRRFGERWRDSWPSMSPNWATSTANAKFRDLWKVFASTLDQTNGLPAKQLTCTQCRRELLSP